MIWLILTYRLSRFFKRGEKIKKKAQTLKKMKMWIRTDVFKNSKMATIQRNIPAVYFILSVSMQFSVRCPELMMRVGMT